MLQNEGILKCCACTELDSQEPRNVATKPIPGITSLGIQVRELNHAEKKQSCCVKWRHDPVSNIQIGSASLQGVRKELLNQGRKQLVTS